MATDKKPLSKQQKLPRQETGVLTERVELSKPEPERRAQNQAEQQPLLPHERDETTGPASAGKANENEMSREVIGQAAEDTEHGLKDTDRRGIPSDIVASDIPAPSVPAAKRKKDTKAT